MSAPHSGMSGRFHRHTGEAMEYYEAFSDLAGVYLEDSWVLELAPSEDGLVLRLDVVLTPEHPLYEAPKPGEQHCYRAAWLTVRAKPVNVHLSGGHRRGTRPEGWTSDTWTRSCSTTRMTAGNSKVTGGRPRQAAPR
jgi:hypothetical protein